MLLSFKEWLLKINNFFLISFFKIQIYRSKLVSSFIDPQKISLNFKDDYTIDKLNYTKLNQFNFQRLFFQHKKTFVQPDEQLFLKTYFNVFELQALIRLEHKERMLENKLVSNLIQKNYEHGFFKWRTLFHEYFAFDIELNLDTIMRHHPREGNNIYTGKGFDRSQRLKLFEYNYYQLTPQVFIIHDMLTPQIYHELINDETDNIDNFKITDEIETIIPMDMETDYDFIISQKSKFLKDQIDMALISKTNSRFSRNFTNLNFNIDIPIFLPFFIKLRKN